ncbi:DUF1294 domain-containing protein [Roseibacillus persicicus]|uniref:DUF1294 domain-containing protein n=1 Tax=Roseibacillus persicicus TaxID=454148 RepID=A0A918TN40_9BACT|nr:DUF1294 domain-containing protein [Roseibacillus persicicus]GHC54293.1 hypothetical protein GCM10007100_20840 [Roseibacillus persicicus]
MKEDPNPQEKPAAKGPPARKHRAPLSWPWALAIFLGLLFLPVWVAIELSQKIDWRFLATYAALISGLTFAFYFSDKRKAKTDGWRIPESTLHLMEFLAGWPAALLAQRFLRHKTKKASYQLIFWSIICLHQLLAFEVVTNWLISRNLIGLFR